jgi:mycofactocin biosynthesis protein MftB
MEFDQDARWQLDPQVAVRPEPFGALLYHFGTRKLSFLKNRIVVEVIESLPDHPSARAALDAAGVVNTAPYVRALAALANSRMLVAA